MTVEDAYSNETAKVHSSYRFKEKMGFASFPLQLKKSWIRTVT